MAVIIAKAAFIYNAGNNCLETSSILQALADLRYFIQPLETIIAAINQSTGIMNRKGVKMLGKEWMRITLSSEKGD